jgi:outer membrane protein assembly factor BamB
MQRLGEGTTGFSSSPVLADGRLYFASEEGEVYVVKEGDTFELLGKNLLGEIAMASPAVSEGTLYYRTRGHVVAIGR